ncbi:MAG: PKD domain-containing protein [Planctomycetota bacterium]
MATVYGGKKYGTGYYKGVNFQIFASATTGTPPLTVQFTSLIEGVLVSSYAWDFGDTETSVLANPAHTYAAGDYTAELEITDSLGNTASVTMEINVDTYNPSATPTEGPAQLVVTFSLD